jgi:hypothetical protein
VVSLPADLPDADFTKDTATLNDLLFDRDPPSLAAAIDLIVEIYSLGGADVETVSKRVFGGEFGVDLALKVLERVKVTKEEAKKLRKAVYVIGQLEKAVRDRKCVFFLLSHGRRCSF